MSPKSKFLLVLSLLLGISAIWALFLGVQILPWSESAQDHKVARVSFAGIAFSATPPCDANGSSIVCKIVVFNDRAEDSSSISILNASGVTRVRSAASGELARIDTNNIAQSESIEFQLAPGSSAELLVFLPDSVGESKVNSLRLQVEIDGNPMQAQLVIEP